MHEARVCQSRNAAEENTYIQARGHAWRESPFHIERLRSRLLAFRKSQPEPGRDCRELSSGLKYLVRNRKATLTKLIRMGTSTKGPMTVAKTWSELIPKIATATAIPNGVICVLCFELLSGAVNHLKHSCSYENGAGD